MCKWAINHREKNTVKNVRISGGTGGGECRKARALVALPAAPKKYYRADAALLAELCYGTLRCFLSWMR